MVIKTKHIDKDKKRRKKKREEDISTTERMTREGEQRREGEQGEVEKQYNIRQPLEHNNTERDKY